jgi:heme/copper-type cytochrome/quinol oxidase subunit 3
VACALLGYHGLRRFRAGVSLDWEVAGWTVVLGGLIAVGLQIWQLTDLPFFPGSSGYASCFIGWSVMNIALILSGIYWIETLLARQARLRKALREDGGTAQSTLPVARMFRANLEGCAYYWGFIAVVATFFWVLFYVL